MTRFPLSGFVALLRAAGLAVGSDRVLLAHRAVACTGMTDRAQLQAALRCSLCSEAADLPLFDAAFALYWRDPGARLQDLLPALPAAAMLRPRKPPGGGPPRRLLDAIAPPHAWRPRGDSHTVQVGASATGEGQRQALDGVAANELAVARATAARLRAQLPRLPPSRRWQACSRGSVDLAAALRRLQAGRPVLPVPWRQRRPPQHRLLVLLDASGSMADALRPGLLLAHALAGGPRGADPVRCWAFAGSRLQSLTALLRRAPDADAALQALDAAGFRQGGGTRLAEALRGVWQAEGARLRGGACTLLILSDGLDHAPDDPALPAILAAWRRTGARLVWLDPLTREHVGASAALAAGVDQRVALA